MIRGVAHDDPAAADRHAPDRGSIAVEFALLLPMLLMIVFGIIDFGRALNAQITLTRPHAKPPGWRR